MRPRIIILLLLSLAGCTKQAPDIDNLNNGHVYVIGHGGSGLPDINNPYPFNSWQGVVYAVEHDNAEGVETDIQISTDSAIFMYHDVSLESASLCSGCISDQTASMLTQCVLKPSTFTTNVYYLTPVEELLARFSQRDIKPFVFLDIHISECLYTNEILNDYFYRLISSVNALEEKYKAYKWLSVQCNNREWMRMAHNLNPRLHVLLDGVTTADDVLYAANNGFYGIATKDKDITADLTHLAHSKGLMVQLYGANAQADIIDALGKSPDFFLSDNIPLLENILR